MADAGVSLGRLSAALVGDRLFDGETFDSKRDKARLSGQLHAVALIFSDHRWHTLSEISKRIGASEASVSARIRDLRKERFGSHVIEREHVEGGLFQYRMIPG